MTITIVQLIYRAGTAQEASPPDLIRVTCPCRSFYEAPDTVKLNITCSCDITTTFRNGRLTSWVHS